MSVTIKGTTIIMTRGDTLKSKISILDSEGKEYVPIEQDKIRFALKENYTDSEVLIEKDIPYNSLLLHLEPQDTKQLAFKDYVYDIQITLNDGTVDTFIPQGKLKITEEVD